MADHEVTLTIPLGPVMWGAVAYMTIGLALDLPLSILAWKRIASPKRPFWTVYRRTLKYVPIRVLVWPAGVWEVWR